MAKSPADDHPIDPMPERIAPCLATLAQTPPKGPAWSYEVKWDGYRVAVHIEPAGRVRVITRGGFDWTGHFPAITEAAEKLRLRTAIVDGEAVVLDSQGRSDFGMLQRAIKRRPAAIGADRIILYAFDLLYLNGRDLRPLPYSARRALLAPIVAAGDETAIRLSEEVAADPEEFFQVACAHGLEGIVGKRLDRPYRSGRRPEWLKIKCVHRESFVIVGYEPSSTVTGYIRSLVLAAERDDELVYVGSVGSGFSNRDSADLRKILDAIKAKTPAVPNMPKGAVWTEPMLSAEVEYRAWTTDGKLRHPAFKGYSALPLRER